MTELGLQNEKRFQKIVTDFQVQEIAKQKMLKLMLKHETELN
jgi:hypothetical protein